MYTDLKELTSRPLPCLETARAQRENYRQHPINPMNVLYSERLIDIDELNLEGENFYNRNDNPPYYERIPGSIKPLLVRCNVGHRLKAVDSTLRGLGYRLFVHDAWRPTEVQGYFHDNWMPSLVRQMSPELTEEKVRVEVEKYWAAPTHSDDSPAPHSTGGAVDLTVCNLRTGEPLYMGSIFDDVTELARTDYYEQPRHGAGIEPFSFSEARRNRRLLYWCMIEAEFANNPNEWWHFSWGDQMWARLLGREAAHYSSVKPNTAETVGAPPHANYRGA